MNSATALAAEVTEAHGGSRRCVPDEPVTVRFRSAGLAFTSKGQPDTLRDVTAYLSAAPTQAVRLTGTCPRQWEHGTGGSVGLLGHLASLHARGRLLRWSVPDIAAFAAAALWTYLFTPFLLSDPAYELTVLRPLHGRRRLRVRFPARIATHSPVQVLHVDSDGLIRRHDYTALAFGRWARAAQTLDGYRSFDGRLVSTDRRVTPRLAGHAAPGPTLVWIKIDHVQWGIRPDADSGYPRLHTPT